MTLRRVPATLMVIAVAGVVLAAACTPVKKTPPTGCNPDPVSVFGDAFLGAVDVNGDGTDEAWVATTPNAYPVDVALFTVDDDCEYTPVLLDGMPVTFALSVTPGVGAKGVGCADIDLNQFFDFVVIRVATTTDGGVTYDLEEQEYALIGTSLSFIDSHTIPNNPGGASWLGDAGSLECGSVTYP